MKGTQGKDEALLTLARKGCPPDVVREFFDSYCREGVHSAKNNANVKKFRIGLANEIKSVKAKIAGLQKSDARIQSLAKLPIDGGALSDRLSLELSQWPPLSPAELFPSLDTGVLLPSLLAYKKRLDDIQDAFSPKIRRRPRRRLARFALFVRMLSREQASWKEIVEVVSFLQARDSYVGDGYTCDYNDLEDAVEDLKNDSDYDELVRSYQIQVAFVGKYGVILNEERILKILHYINVAATSPGSTVVIFPENIRSTHA